MIFKQRAERRFLESLPPVHTFTSVVDDEHLGRSVTADVKIEAGVLIGIYPGLRLSEEEFLQKEEFSLRAMKAAFRISKECIVDPTDIFGCVSNHPAKRLALVNEPPMGKQVNVLPVVTKRNVWFLAIRTVNAGEALYTTYGSHYERSYETPSFEIDSELEAVISRSVKKYPWLSKAVTKILQTN